jgi:RNA polymerase sigma-70 factor (ECF subfamily)
MHKALIVKVASAYCQDRTSRTDLISEIILQLWQSFPKYDNTYAFSTWTYRIALNVSISNLRKEKSRKKTESAYLQMKHILEWSDENSEQRMVKINEIINHLKPMDKAIMIMILDGCKNQEIAEVLGISLSNVSTRTSRVKQQIISKMKSKKT